MKKMIVEYLIDETEFQALMDYEDLTLEEAIDQELADGSLDLNEIVFTGFRIEDHVPEKIK